MIPLRAYSRPLEPAKGGPERSRTARVTRICPACAAVCARAAVLTTVPIAVRSRCYPPNSPKLTIPLSIPMPIPERLVIAIQRFGQDATLGAAAAMYFARRLDRACRVIGLTDRKVEDRHNSVADRLVEQPVVSQIAVALSS